MSPALQGGQELFELGLLLGGIDVDSGQECLDLFLDGGGYFARWLLTASALQAGKSRRGGEGAESLSPSDSSFDCSNAASKPVDFNRPGRAQGLGQPD